MHTASSKDTLLVFRGLAFCNGIRARQYSSVRHLQRCSIHLCIRDCGHLRMHQLYHENELELQPANVSHMEFPELAHLAVEPKPEPPTGGRRLKSWNWLCAQTWTRSSRR